MGNVAGDKAICPAGFWGLALLLAPVVIVGGLILRHKLRKAVAEMETRLNEARRQADGDVIDADYRVVDEERPRR